MGKRLAIVCLAFGLPLAVMFTLLTRARLAESDFARKELAGDAFLRPLRAVLEHGARHRVLRARGASAADIDARAGEVDRALDAVEAISRRHEADLQLDGSGLAQRRREAFTPAGLRARWREAAASGPDREEAAEAALFAHVRTMITHGGDTSNLILDPDLDSYYLMDATLLALPQMEDRLGVLQRQIERLGAGRAPDASTRARLATTRAFLAEADWERISTSLEKAIDEDGNFHGQSPTLAAALKGPLGEARRRTERFLSDLDALTSTDGPLPEATLLALRDDGDALASALHALHRVALDEEDILLSIRVHDIHHELWVGVALGVLSIVVASVFAFFLASDLTKRVRRLAAVTNRFASGDLSARVGAAGSDEIGELAGSFDTMAASIGALTSEVGRRAEELASLNAGLEETVAQRTAALRARSDELRLILDTCTEGMTTIDLEGSLSTERSRRLVDWLGVPPTGPATLDACIEPHAPVTAAELRLSLEQLRDDILPSEVILDQLPRRFDVGARHFELAFRPIEDAGKITHLLAVLSDVTEALAAKRAAEREAETVRIIQAWKRDARSLHEFASDARATVERLCDPARRPHGAETMRLLHTLKGTSAIFGLMSFASACHEIESEALDAGRELPPHAVDRLRAAWEEAAASLHRVCGDTGEARIEVRRSEHTQLLEAIARGAPRPQLAETLATWRMDLAEKHLARFAEEARVVASRLGKEVVVSIKANGLRLDARAWAPVWRVFTHVVRNAVNHGVENVEERLAASKPKAGRISLSTDMRGEVIALELADDGAGIRWERLAERARAAGLPSETREDLVEALFADGVSTQSEVTEVAGRGVGLSAVREQVRKLGGDVLVTSEPGRGTRFRIELPLATMLGADTETALRSFAPSMAPAA